LTVATENVQARRPQPTATSKALIGTDADIVSIQEIESKSGRIIEQVMGQSYSHHVTLGSVGPWSKYPISDAYRLELGPSWRYSLSATVHAPDGDVRVYAAHLPSVRIGQDALRNQAVEKLSRLVVDDASTRVIVAG